MPRRPKSWNSLKKIKNIYYTISQKSVLNTSEQRNGRHEETQRMKNTRMKSEWVSNKRVAQLYYRILDRNKDREIDQCMKQLGWGSGALHYGKKEKKKSHSKKYDLESNILCDSV